MGSCRRGNARTARPVKLLKTSQEGHDHDVCPNCGTELCAGRIYEDWGKHFHPDDPERQAEYAEAYGAGPLAAADPERLGPVHICGSKTLGIDVPGYDGVGIYVYPCCGATYDRWTGNRMNDWYPQESDGAV